jgi:hypothetical protein
MIDKTLHRSRMRGRVAVAVLTAALFATSALAATPSQLILQKSDLPAGVKKLAFKMGKNGTATIPKVGRVRFAGALYKAGTKYIGTVAGIFTSSKAATTSFKRFSKVPRFKPIHLPRLGDQQTALGYFSTGVNSAVVLVRTGSVVWETSLSTLGGGSRARTIADLTALARKQKARVD